MDRCIIVCELQRGRFSDEFFPFEFSFYLQTKDVWSTVRIFKACTLWEQLGYRWQVARRNFCTTCSSMMWVSRKREHELGPATCWNVGIKFLFSQPFECIIDRHIYAWVPAGVGKEGHLSPLGKCQRCPFSYHVLVCTKKLNLTRQVLQVQNMSKCVCGRGCTPNPAGKLYSAPPHLPAAVEPFLRGGDGQGPRSHGVRGSIDPPTFSGAGSTYGAWPLTFCRVHLCSICSCRTRLSTVVIKLN